MSIVMAQTPGFAQRRARKIHECVYRSLITRETRAQIHLVQIALSTKSCPVRNLRVPQLKKGRIAARPFSSVGRESSAQKLYAMSSRLKLVSIEDFGA